MSQAFGCSQIRGRFKIHGIVRESVLQVSFEGLETSARGEFSLSVSHSRFKLGASASGSFQLLPQCLHPPPWTLNPWSMGQRAVAIRQSRTGEHLELRRLAEVRRVPGCSPRQLQSLRSNGTLGNCFPPISAEWVKEGSPWWVGYYALPHPTSTFFAPL